MHGLKQKILVAVPLDVSPPPLLQRISPVLLPNLTEAKISSEEGATSVPDDKT